MLRLEWLFLMQAIMGIIMIVLLQKLMQMKKQIDEIIQEVTSYITYITEANREEVRMEKKRKEEDQNQLIQAVLGEFFP